jgi:hypothetical protein
MIFKDSIKLQEYAQLSGEVNYVGLKPTLRIVEQKYILTVLGKELYEELDTAYTAATNESSLSVRLKNLLTQCRMVAGPMFCVMYAPKSDVLLSDSGMQRTETTNNKTAYQYQGTKFIEANLREAEDATELLLQFLEINKVDYPTWVNSDQFKEYKILFIKTGGAFDTFFPSASPQRNYFAMRQKMIDVEQIHIKKMLGSTLYTDLKTKDVAGTTSEKEKELLFKIKKAVANLTVAFAIPFLNVKINAEGLSVMASASFSTNDAQNVRQQVMDKSLSSFREACLTTGQEWIKEAQEYLTANQSDFTSWTGFTTATTVSTESPNKNFITTFGIV